MLSRCNIKSFKQNLKITEKYFDLKRFIYWIIYQWESFSSRMQNSHKDFQPVESIEKIKKWFIFKMYISKLLFNEFLQITKGRRCVDISLNN